MGLRIQVSYLLKINKLDVRNEMVIVVENGYGEQCSNPGRGYLNYYPNYV